MFSDFFDYFCYLFNFCTQTIARVLLFLPMHLRGDLQSQRVEPDEAGGVVLIVGLGRVGFHRGVHGLFK